MHPAITYTLLTFCAAILGLGIWAEGRKDGSRGVNLRKYALAMQIGAVVAAYFVLRPGRGDDPHRVMSASASAHRPVLMDIYSNW
jgi:hypothetical protein